MVASVTAEKLFTQQERDALVTASHILIDALFDEYRLVKSWKPETLLTTRLGKYLPKPFLLKYTPLFYKELGVCVISIAWKLVQPKPLLPASVGEQLAAWAIVEEAKALLNGNEGHGPDTTQAFQVFTRWYFPDTTFLLLFDPAHDGLETSSQTGLQISLAFKDWFRPFSNTQAHIVHPYAFDGETRRDVGRAYKSWLTRSEQEALAAGIAVLVDGLFDDFYRLDNEEVSDFILTELAWHLPPQYLSYYTSQFRKQFVVCVIHVAWKLASRKPFALASVGEELAAWAIVNAAKRQVALEFEEDEEAGEQAAENAFEIFIEAFFEDEDFLFLFDDNTEGIDTSLVGLWLHMTSLAVEDWLRPFTDEQARRAHPYVFQGVI